MKADSCFHQRSSAGRSQATTYAQYIKTQAKGVQQHHCWHLPLLPGVPVARRSGLSDKARSEPILLPSKLWETRGPAVCHSLLYVLGDQHKGEKLSQKTLFAGSPHADAGALEHANQQMLCICCLQAPHSSHPVCAAALQRNIPFTVPPALQPGGSTMPAF